MKLHTKYKKKETFVNPMFILDAIIEIGLEKVYGPGRNRLLRQDGFRAVYGRAEFDPEEIRYRQINGGTIPWNGALIGPSTGSGYGQCDG
jgi:hypothetical protein